MLHIIQNDPEVPPSTIIEHLTLPYLVRHPYRDGPLPQRKQILALIVLGGAMGANDDQRHPFICNLKKLIREVVAARIPYLGICLGGQLLAAALGAQVVSSRWEEIGHFSAVLTEEGQRDPLFQGLNPDFLTFQWHHDSFDIPAGGVVTEGGCAGLTYAAEIGREMNDGESPVLEQGNIRVVSDANSLKYLDGLVIDYSDDLFNGGLKFTNSNTKSTCSCGSSFSLSGFPEIISGKCKS